MANTKIIEQKQGIVSEIEEKVKGASSVVFFEYRGLTVGEMMELRRKLKEVNADLKIYKNTLAKRALDSLNFDFGNELVGPKAIAFGLDGISPIKILYTFAKTHPALEIKAGLVDGEKTDVAKLTQLATLPSRDELLTMLAGSLIATVKDLSIGLDLYSKKLEN